MRTKYYDKEIYIRDEYMKSAILIMIIFILGFAVGCIATSIERKSIIIELQNNIQEKQNKIDEQFLELDSLKETLYMYEIYGR